MNATAEKILDTTPDVMTVAEALYVLNSTGLPVQHHEGADGTVSVYVDGSHAFDYYEQLPTIAARYVRSTLNDLGEV